METITLIIFGIVLIILMGFLPFLMIWDLLTNDFKNNSIGKMLLAGAITFGLMLFMLSYFPIWDKISKSTVSTSSSTSSSSSSFVEFLMLIGVIFFLGWFWKWWTNFDFSIKKVKSLFRNESTTTKQSARVETVVASKEIIQSDYDLFSDEINLINEAIAEDSTLEFLSDGTYKEPIKFKPVEIASGRNGLVVKGTWIYELSEETNCFFELKKISNIRTIS